MKLFKKLLAVTLVAVLALTVFTACDGVGNADDIPSNPTEMRYWQTLNNNARTYKTSDGKVLTDVKYSKDLSDYTAKKLNAYLNLMNEHPTLSGGNERYTDPELKNKMKEIDAAGQKAKGYKSTVYVISDGDSEPKYEVLYAENNFCWENATDAFFKADFITIARQKNSGDGKTYTMMECYQKVNK